MEAPDKFPTANGDLVVQPVDHASFVLSLGDQVIYVDPIGGGPRYAELPRPTGILITHEHGDHFDTATLDALIGDANVPLVVARGVMSKLDARRQGQAEAVGYGDRTTLQGFPIEVIEAYNTTEDRLRYHPKGLGNGYVIMMGGKRIYVAGDTEPNPDMLRLKDIDIAFLPMNLPYTMVAEQAAEAVRAFRPRIVYPFHYTKGPEPEKFTKLVEGEKGIEVRLRDWYLLSP